MTFRLESSSRRDVARNMDRSLRTHLIILSQLQFVG